MPLKYYNIKNGDVLSEVIEPVFDINVTASKRKMVILKASSTMEVRQVKELYRDKAGSLPAGSYLLYKNKRLQDEDTLGKYGIKERSTLSFV